MVKIYTKYKFKIVVIINQNKANNNSAPEHSFIGARKERLNNREGKDKAW